MNQQEMIQEIWNEVVSMMEISLNSVQILFWIHPLKPLHLSDDTLIVDCENSFVKNMVSTKYLDRMEECLSFLYKKPMKIRLIEPNEDEYDLLTRRAKVDDTGQIQLNYTEDAEDGETLPEEAEDEDLSSITEVVTNVKNSELLRQQNGYYMLNKKYTFSNFVSGSSNRLAHAAAVAVSERPGELYNPLFIYGGSGLGKTHLMQAIAHEVLRRDPTKRIVYTSSEDLTNELVSMIQYGDFNSREKFQKKYRETDLLCIDDIQFIAGKIETSEEVFNIFNVLKEKGKQIVLSSDKKPEDLKNLEERLVSRFSGGYSVDVQKPDFETRAAILQKLLSEEKEVRLPQYAIDFIAQHRDANVRVLEGSLTTVIAHYHLLKKDPMTMDKETVLADLKKILDITNEEKEITLDLIITETGKYYDIKKEDLVSRSRQSSIAMARQVAMYLSRELTNESLVNIGQAFDRDHSTVIHGYDKVKALIEEKPDLKMEVEALEKIIKDE